MKCIFFIAIISMLVSCNSRLPNKTGFEGKALPDFKLLLLDSSTYLNTGSIPTGKPFTVIYIGTHCPYSKAQVEEIVERIKDLKGFSIYIITADSFREMNKLAKHYQLYQYENIVVGVDTKDAFGNFYKITGMPFTALYGKDKLLKKAFSGNLSSRIIEKELSE